MEVLTVTPSILQQREPGWIYKKWWDLSLHYLFFVAVTGAAVLLILFVRMVTTLTSDQSYFIVVLSSLLIHYHFDHFLFTRTEYIR